MGEEEGNMRWRCWLDPGITGALQLFQRGKASLPFALPLPPPPKGIASPESCLLGFSQEAMGRAR